MNAIGIIAILVILLLGAVLYRSRGPKSPLDLFGWGPPWDLRFVPGIVAVAVFLVYFLAPHWHVAQVIDSIISNWFR